MITLDLLRHGEARPAARGGDGARELSAHGQRMIDRLGAHLGTLDWHPDHAYASPLTRAQQTAARVLAAARVTLATATLAELAPDGDAGSVIAALAAHHPGGGHVLLVGHQPLIGELVGWCAGGDAASVVPGQLVRLRFAGGLVRGEGSLLLTLRPELL